MSLLSAPTWILVAVLVLLVVILVGPERPYQRAVGLLQAFRGTGPDGQESHAPRGESEPSRGQEPRKGAADDGEQAA